MDTDEIEMRIINPFDVFPARTKEVRIIFEYGDEDTLIIDATYENTGDSWKVKESQIIYSSTELFVSSAVLSASLFKEYETIVTPHDLVPQNTNIQLVIVTIKPHSLKDLYQALVNSCKFEEQWDKCLPTYIVHHDELSDKEKVQLIAILDTYFGTDGYEVLEKHPSILKNGLNSYELKQKLYLFI